MRKASDFLSKPLISLNEGKNEGVIKNISFDAKLKAAEWLVLYDENDCDCDEKAVPVSEAYSVGENAVMIKSGQAVVPAVSAPIFDNNPINCRIFTALGKLVGVVSDVILTDENRTAQLVYDKDKILPLSEIISSSRDIVIKSEGVIKAAEPVPPKKVPAPSPEDTKRKVRALTKEKAKPAADAAGQQEPGAGNKEKPVQTPAPEKDNKASRNKKTAPKRTIKKNESAEVTAESVGAKPEPLKPGSAGPATEPAGTKPEPVKSAQAAGPATDSAGTAPKHIKTAGRVKAETEAAEESREETPFITADSGEPKPKPFKAEDIVIKEPAAPRAQPEPRAENPYKIYDDISVNFTDLYQPEVFVYGTAGDLGRNGSGEAEGDDTERGLGIAVPIKKKHKPGDSRKEQFVRAFQLRHDPVPATPAEPAAQLIFDSGSGIEIWPLELEHIPERIIASYSFLLGRRVAKNIYNAARQLVIKADTVVNPQIVETARKYGRLVDLTKLSL